MQRIEAAEATQPPHLSLSPELAAGWRQVNEPEAQWKPVYQNPSAEAAAQYASQAGQKVGIYLAYYRQQDEARKLVSSTNVLVSSKDKSWNAVEARDKVISLPSRSLAVHEARVLPSTVSGTPDRAGMLVWQFYWINGSLTASDHEAKLLGAWHRLMGRGDESAAIVLYAADTPSRPGMAALESFVRENLSMIEAGLAATSRAH
jgi:EpsI family protein